MLRIPFFPFLVGLFLVSAIVGVGLARLLDPQVCFGIVIIFMLLPQYAILLGLPLFITRSQATEFIIVRMQLYSLVFGFFALVTIVSIRDLGHGYRFAAILFIIAALVWAGRDLLQFARDRQREHAFSQLRH